MVLIWSWKFKGEQPFVNIQFSAYFLGELKMRTNIKFFIVIVLLFVTSACFGQENKGDSEAVKVEISPVVKDEGVAEKSTLPEVPYIAEITGTDVYVRSGPGRSYYFCSKLNSPEKVTVVGHEHGWLEIIPPHGSF